MKIEVKSSVAGILWWREKEGIWHLKISAGHEVTAEDAEVLLAALAGFRDGKAPMLVDRSNSYSPSLGAMRMWPRIATFVSALAYYVPTKAARVASMAMIEDVLNGVIEHVALFDNEADAVKWLVTHRG